MFPLLFFYAGLTYWALADWRHRSVPARPFESWCLLTYVWQLAHGAAWWPPLVWWLAFSAVARCGWLGSADAWLIGVLASRFAFLPLLWLLLCACLTGIIHATAARERELPWLPHLAAATLIIQAVLTAIP